MFIIEEIKQSLLKILEVQELLYEEILDIKLVLSNFKKEDYEIENLNLLNSKKVSDEELKNLLKGKEILMKKEVDIVPNKNFIDID